jgi:hypothetical protein
MFGNLFFVAWARVDRVPVAYQTSLQLSELSDIGLASDFTHSFAIPSSQEFFHMRFITYGLAR